MPPKFKFDHKAEYVPNLRKEAVYEDDEGSVDYAFDDKYKHKIIQPEITERRQNQNLINSRAFR